MLVELSGSWSRRDPPHRDIRGFFAVLLTMLFGLAGIAGVNPVFFLEVLLVPELRNAGHIGPDLWVLKRVGTPWERAVTIRTPDVTTEKEPATIPTGEAREPDTK